ncbi:MAG: hypothetical protein Q9217_005331 [Psora testacea]
MASKRARPSINYNEIDTDSGDDAGFDVSKRARREDLDHVEGTNELLTVNVSSSNHKLEPRTHPNTRIDLNPQYDANKAGFMSLPAEIRLSIYKLVFINESCIDFGRRRNFAHSSHFLRANRTVNNEGTSVLYGQNKFILHPSKDKAGLWDEHWGWLGYRGIRKFLATIGTTNLALLKTIALIFYDAAPTDEPKTSFELRRFQYNKDLLWSLNQLAKYATSIETLKLSFAGRSAFRRDASPAAEEFSATLKLLKADIVTIGDRYNRYESGPKPRVLWWSDKSKRHHQIFDEKIPQEGAAYFVTRMTRAPPINAQLLAKYEWFVVEK